ncbi:hypothetical protein L2E82_36928 [Cichorium intybus]|uniref:Uncharacterized protein n=1 Tax=Cichorium intybus TaxID=13427 RepID=A0ACB9AD82_CICIN|nr:hypothetical protein L2E82_36928 [Cichorium intybus]
MNKRYSELTFDKFYTVKENKTISPRFFPTSPGLSRITHEIAVHLLRSSLHKISVAVAVAVYLFGGSQGTHYPKA